MSDGMRRRAALHRAMAAQHSLIAATIGAATAFQDLISAARDGDARDIAAHPDLAYLDVQMDGFYGEAS
ncbi:hypothetical protein C1I98_13480 [Spongiactinospora gelatinilytica]|uniref:Uncharacterized protein n=1 Tax=Spongiactinospora gelatinilytica TaxID=2666298 RepID=A0A2W2GCQ6_9ACTN|nr:hypothetical protein [Spongiactinospora gelatinilytica]PZG47476.1 hypothetical protein C1I98_13480 [Spongiactinospora gelatinilytica]